MSESPEPKKSRRKKGKKVTINAKKNWQEILGQVEKHEVPINLLQSIVVNLIDGTSVTINIRQLLEEMEDPEYVEDLLQHKFEELDDYIDNVDFFIDIEKVAEEVQPITDLVLKGI
jgi:hypothetical protein